MAMTSARSIKLGNMYFTDSACPSITRPHILVSLAAGQTPLLDNRKGLLELRNIAAARMTPAAAGAGGAARGRVEAAAWTALR